MSLAEEHEPATGDRLTPEELHWHILRYDALRGSVAARASYVLGADALVLAGTGLALDQLTGHDPVAALRIAALAVIAALLGCVSASIWASIGALTTAKSSGGEEQLPRGLYGWSSAKDDCATYGAFRGVLARHNAAAGARAELYVGIRQHIERYGRLRLAMWTMRGGLACFAVLTALVASAALL
jgi:hypothetical protein